MKSFLTKGRVALGGAIVSASTSSFAGGLTAADFDTTGASANITLAAVAVITLSVLIMGYKGVRSMLH